jgi:phage-related protein
MEFENVTGGIIVDSELCDCFTADGLMLANNLATLDEFPTLKAGANTIAWAGAVTKVVITPRWRDL